MGTPTLPDIDLVASAFDAANADYVATKGNYDAAGNLVGPLPTSLIASQMTAEYGDWVDNLLRLLAARNQTGTAAPTTGTSRAGDFVRNTGWSASTDPVGWLCTAAGSPGTWLALGAAAAAVSEVLYDVDFAALANNTLNDGTESIDGFDWAATNEAGADTFAIENGTGLHFEASTTTGALDESTQTATMLEIEPEVLIPSWDPLRAYVIELYCPTLSLPTSGNRVQVGLLGDSAGTDEIIGGGPRNTSSNLDMFVWADGSALGPGVDLGTHPSAFAVRVDGSRVGCVGGNYAAESFPTGAGWTAGAGSGLHDHSAISVMNPAYSSLYIAFVQGATTGTMDVVVERMRIRGPY